MVVGEIVVGIAELTKQLVVGHISDAAKSGLKNSLTSICGGCVEIEITETAGGGGGINGTVGIDAGHRDGYANVSVWVDEKTR